MGLLDTLNTQINRAICACLTVIFSAMVAVVFFQVVFRYSLEQPLAWSEESARYLFVWATFLGASVAFYEGTHICVTYFVNLCSSPRRRALVMILADLSSLGFLAAFVYYGFVAAYRIHGLGQFSPSMEWLSIGAVFLAIPLGSLFMLLNVLAVMLRHLHTWRTGETLAPPAQPH